MSASLIISGLVALAGTLFSGYAQNSQTESSRKEQKNLALIARQDELGAQEKSFGLKQEELGIVKRKNSFEMQQQKKMMRQQQLLNLGSSLDSLSKKDQNMTNFVLSLYNKNAYNSKGIGV